MTDISFTDHILPRAQLKVLNGMDAPLALLRSCEELAETCPQCHGELERSGPECRGHCRDCEQAGQ